MTVVTQFPTANEDSDAPSLGWSNPNNAHADDGVNASVFQANLGGQTRWFTFGFDAVIPAGATINTVKVIVEHSDGANDANLGSQPTIGGVLQTLRLFTNRVVLTVDTNDHTADRAWVRADLLDASFKVRIEGFPGSIGDVIMDYVKVQVDYTSATPAAPQDWQNWSDSPQPLPGPSVEALPWTRL